MNKRLRHNLNRTWDQSRPEAIEARRQAAKFHAQIDIEWRNRQAEQERRRSALGCCCPLLLERPFGQPRGRFGLWRTDSR